MAAEAQDLAWTGERLVTYVEGDLILEHLHRYAAAMELVDGKRVLDIACGEGYGTNLLAQRARLAVGVDISSEAADHAHRKYGHGYLAGSCAAIPFRDASFDVVVSFETLEHIHEQEEFLGEVRRVLAPDGLLVVCTPDKQVYSDDRDYQNEFHVKELYHQEFGDLLRARFGNVALYRQKVGFGSLLLPDPGSAAHIGRFRASFEGTGFEEGLSDGMYTTALASDAELPALPCGLLAEEGHEDAHGRLEQTRTVLEEAQATVLRLRGERKRNQRVIGALAILLVVSLLASLLSGCGGGEESPHGQVHATLVASGARRAGRVILITCDTLRADHVGGDLGLTPQLDALAAEAVVYPRTFSPSPTTGPAFSSLFTGQLPGDLGVAGGNAYVLPAAIDTLAEHLTHAGVLTGGVVSNFVLRRFGPDKGYIGVSQGFAHYDDELPTKERNRNNFERLAPDTTESAVRWLDELAAEGTDEFFLWVHYMDPHGPYTPPEELLEKHAGTLPAGEPLAFGTTHSGIDQVPRYQVLPEHTTAGPYRELYRAEVEAMDAGVGGLVAHLRELGWLDDALVIFTADHGEALGEHGYWFCHGEAVHASVVHVPMFVRFPGGASAGTSERVVSTLDIYPTVLEAFGLTPDESRGVSLFDVAVRTTAVQELVSSYDGSVWRAATDGRFQLIKQPDAPLRLYDLEGDPQADVADAHPGVVEALHRARAPARRDLPSPVVIGPGDAAHQAALDALGYTGGDEDEE